ncbi:MAG: UvrD-helicase domain-containing protein [Treponema sp.]|nr:UvrD-helicase domain-containing protein [Treponema sp.]
MKSILSSLNEQQQNAVRQTEGYVRVMAGAGSGKTRTLISRYCYLVNEAGIAPGNILCVTFTNRAANEMKFRVRNQLGDLDLGYICTFHAFCVQLLKEDINVLNYPKNFIILDTEDEREILLRIFDDMHLTMRDTTIQRTIDDVLEARKLKADSYISDIYRLNNEQLRERFNVIKDRDDQIFARYIYEQKKCFGLDFNDLINFATYILENFPAVREKWQDRMEYVMVDEFQDVSKKQYRIAQILSAKHENLFIVGDSDQTIYSWRGSHVKLFLDFDKKYPDAQTFLLTENYRSSPEILTVANTLIAKNTVRYPKKLIPMNHSEQKPAYCHCKNEQEEALWIFKQIHILTDSGVRYGEIAVLYRAHYLSRPVEECFIEKQIPYKFYSGIEFYSRKEIKDLVCYLRMLTSADDIAFLRTINTPSRKIGRKKIDVLKHEAETENKSLYEVLKQMVETPLFTGTNARQYIDAVDSLRGTYKTMPLGTILQAVMDRTGYEAYLRLQSDQDRLDNVAEFRRAVETAGQDDDADLEDFLAHIALFSDLDRDAEQDNVKLMTIHTAKGMEFPYVFICGMNEGVFPSRKTITPEDMEEERRIAYVGMTRAEKGLFLSDSEGTASDGIFKYPSRFIFDAGIENMKLEKQLDKSLVEQASKIITYSEEQLKRIGNILPAGSRIHHDVFGDGTITEVNKKDGCYFIKFDSMKTLRSIRFEIKLTVLK